LELVLATQELFEIGEHNLISTDFDEKDMKGHYQTLLILRNAREQRRGH
jgi:hypothetical protein